MNEWKNLAGALATGLTNLVEAATSKKMIGLAITVAAGYFASQHAPGAVPYIFGAGGANQLAQGLSDAFGKGKVEAEGKQERITMRELTKP